MGSALDKNSDNFYINGRFRQRYEMDNIQVSVEGSGNEFFYAVYDDIQIRKNEEKPAFSMARELKKVHEEIKGNGKSIESNLGRIRDCLKEVDSLAFSASVDNPSNKCDINFAGMLISNNMAAALNVGGNRVYLLRDGALKLMTNDNAKIEKLLKLGIITQEQAKILSTHLGISSGSSDSGEVLTSEAVELRKGDVFLLCSSGLTNSVVEEKIQEILSLEEDASFMSNMLVREAVRNGADKNITTLVVKVEEVEGQPVSAGRNTVDEVEEEALPTAARRFRRAPEPDFEEPPEDTFKTYIAAAVACVIIAGLIFLAYRVWLGSGDKTAYNENNNHPSTTVENTVDQPDETTDPNDVSESPEPTPGQDSKESPEPGDDADDSQQAEEPVRYVVQSGDSLQAISKKFYGDVNKYTLIMEANDIKNPDIINVGDVLIIPPDPGQ